MSNNNESKWPIDINQKVDPEIVKELTSPISFGKIVEKPSYDFEFITQSLGLISIQRGEAAFNPGAVISLERDADNDWVLSLHGGEDFVLSAEDMAELETTFRNRIEDQKVRQAEAFEQHKAQQAELAKAQIRAQAEALAELNQGVQPGMIVGAPTGKGWRKH